MAYRSGTLRDVWKPLTDLGVPLGLITGGVGDTHEVITPEAINPQTAAELFAAMIERDGADRSALTEIREAADPHTRLTLAAGAYQHAVLAGAEYLVGQATLDQLAERADQAVPGITTAHAWPALREHLAVLHLGGRDPIGELATAAAAWDLGGARDPAATLDWRLDPTGNHSLGAGPLPWLPAIPAQLAAEPTWGPTWPREGTSSTSSPPRSATTSSSGRRRLRRRGPSPTCPTES